MRSDIAKWSRARIDLFALVFLISLSGFLHFWRLTTPDALVFDEVYFPVYAQNYLEGTPFFDSHPPLGKYIIAIGIRFFGFNPLGYRVMDALFGIGVIVLIYLIARLLFSDRRMAFLAGLFACLDGLLLVESRAGLINIFAVFFSLAAYYLFLKSGLQNPEKPRWVYVLGAGVFIGAAASVKWIGAASMGVILAVYGLAFLGHKFSVVKRWLPENELFARIGRLKPGIVLSCCILLPALIYAATFPVHLKQNPEYPFVELHKQMFGYHAHLQEGHHYASPWWTWPLAIRPVSYYWQVDESTQQGTAILNLGNPVMWWLAIPAILFALWQAIVRREFGVQFALLAFAAHYLPFAIISRATFSYHFMGALPFSIMLLAFILAGLWRAGGWRQEIAAAAIAAIILCAIYFYPVWTGLPIPVGAFYQRMWLTSWI